MTKGRPPSGRTPYRYKKNGKHIGSFFVRVGKEEINLKTKDANDANARAKRARAGEREFSYDSDAAVSANAVTAAITGTGGARSAPVVEPPAAPAPSLPPPAPPVASVQPAALHSVHTPPAALPTTPAAPPPAAAGDAYIPPPLGWAEGARAAAAAASSARPDEGGEGADAEEEAGSVLTPDMLEDAIDEAAGRVVELQLMLQSWLAAKGWIAPGIKIQTAPVDPSNKGRVISKRIWKRCFTRLAARLMPNLEIPDYIAAPVMLLALSLPAQFGEGATEIVDDKAKETATSSAGAPAAAAA